MTIQEAIKSGKAFKLNGSAYWLCVQNGYIFIEIHPECIAPLGALDILADDWIVREE